VIIGGVCNIETFNVVDKVCSLVSIGVRPIYIILPSFFTLESNSHILGGQVPFVEFFISKALEEDLNMNASLPMFVNPKVALLCPVAKLPPTYYIPFYLVTLH